MSSKNKLPKKKNLKMEAIRAGAMEYVVDGIESGKTGVVLIDGYAPCGCSVKIPVTGFSPRCDETPKGMVYDLSNVISDKKVCACVCDNPEHYTYSVVFGESVKDCIDEIAPGGVITTAGCDKE